MLQWHTLRLSSGTTRVDDYARISRLNIGRRNGLFTSRPDEQTATGIRNVEQLITIVKIC